MLNVADRTSTDLFCHGFSHNRVDPLSFREQLSVGFSTQSGGSRLSLQAPYITLHGLSREVAHKTNLTSHARILFFATLHGLAKNRSGKLTNWYVDAARARPIKIRYQQVGSHPGEEAPGSGFWAGRTDGAVSGPQIVNFTRPSHIIHGRSIPLGSFSAGYVAVMAAPFRSRDSSRTSTYPRSCLYVVVVDYN